ncbi:hypothetical protein AB0D86_46265 [Streptomyces sp. NPDC048324]|uniref:hypothetical protein n=1 Tax=Streptomyces sp. NPDC048324 TaxID=3157205 RepID=UPI00343A977B
MRSTSAWMGAPERQDQGEQPSGSPFSSSASASASKMSPWRPDHSWAVTRSIGA